MIITIDGGDGCGKSTLANKLAEKYGFYYIKKPIDDILGVKEENSARAKFSKLVQKMIYDINKFEPAKVAFNSGLLLFYKNKLKDENVIIDRGLLSCYLFNGSPKTNTTFDYFIKKGLNFDLSIFLKASNETRLQRLAARNNLDSDIDDEKINELSDNQDNAIEFAESRNLNTIVIETDDKDAEQVFEEACFHIDQLISNQDKKDKSDDSLMLEQDSEMSE